MESSLKRSAISKKNNDDSGGTIRKLTSFFSKECLICQCNYRGSGPWCQDCSGGYIVSGKYSGKVYRWIVKKDIKYAHELVTRNTESCFSDFRRWARSNKMVIEKIMKYGANTKLRSLREEDLFESSIPSEEQDSDVSCSETEICSECEYFNTDSHSEEEIPKLPSIIKRSSGFNNRVDNIQHKNDIMSVGKHLGHTYEEIMDSDKSYCNWVLYKCKPKRGPLHNFKIWLERNSGL